MTVQIYRVSWESQLSSAKTVSKVNEILNGIRPHKETDVELVRTLEEEWQNKINAIEDIIKLAADNGIPYREWRSRTRKPSGWEELKWVKELRETIPSPVRSPSVKKVLQQYDKLEELAKKRREDIEAELNNRKRIAEAEREKKELDALAIRIAVKYNLPETLIDRSEIFYTLVTSNKYLNLAYAMEQTRGDWSEGFWRVSNALSEFPIENEADQAIYDDISECLDDTDGRIFRDTRYNYLHIYKTFVDEELYKDVFSIEHGDDW